MANKKDLARALAGDKNLSGANLSGANLSLADLSGANLGGADLVNANLTSTDLSRADLHQANLTRASLTGAKIIGANLRSANLTRASLAFAELDDANLRFANLTRANLEGAFLDGAVLAFAKLDGAVLTDTILDARPRKRAARSNPSPGKTAAQVTSRATRRILADIKNNVLPYDIDSFSELHKYVDGNTYLLDDHGNKDATMATLRTAVEQIEEWLMIRSATMETGGSPVRSRKNPAKRAALTSVTQWSSKQITAWINSALGDNGHVHVAAQIIGKGRIALAVGKKGVIADARGSTEKAALLALAREIGMLR
jgi:hypothetical protein